MKVSSLARVAGWAAGVLVLGLALGWLYDGWTHQASIDAVLRDVAAGRTGESREVLERLYWRDPGAGEGRVALALGVCEELGGRLEEADRIWASVRAPVERVRQASLLRARLALAQHRYARAEPLLRAAIDEPGPTGIEARQSLALILKYQGRIDEAAELLRAGFERLPSPLATLRELWDLGYAPFPVQQVGQTLAQAEALAGDDARVCLARAHLARVQGRLDEAERLLNGCVAGDEPDRAVALEGVRLALDRMDLTALARWLARLGDEAVEPRLRCALAAWVARVAGDVEAELGALRAGVEARPLDLALMERLAEVLERRGERVESESLRARKARLERVLEEYRDALFFVRDPLMASVAQSERARALGWEWETRTWLRLALQRDPGNDAVRSALMEIGMDSGGQADGAGVPSVAAIRSALSALAWDADGATGGRRVVPFFRDEAGRAGLVFRYDPGRMRRRELPETMGGGVALLDFDRDGWMDVYVVQGGSFPPEEGALCADRLFRNRGDGMFEDESERAGLASMRGGYGMGVATGDVDGDGFCDVFVTRWRSYALLRNRGDGTFEDVTEGWGLGGDRDWPSSAVLADLDGDGDLDLYVCHYLVWDEARRFGSRTDRNLDSSRYNNPLNYEALPDRLYRNDGAGFVDVSEESGVAAIDREGRGLGVLAADFDGDALLDLYVANDLTANFLLRNLGGLRFEEAGGRAGVSGSAEGLFQGSMGVASGDLDGDGLLDLATSNFYGDGMAVYQAVAPGLFTERAVAWGVKVPTRYMVGWGMAFADFDNDGWLDLAVCNGHLDEPQDGAAYAMPTQLFMNRGMGRFEDMGERAGLDWSRPRVSRALAVGDLDNDGRLDVVLVGHDTPLVYLRNMTSAVGRSLVLELQAKAAGGAATGAVVTVEAGGRRWRVACVGGGSYQSASDPRLHVGVGDAERVERVRVGWPSGREDVHEGLEADRGYRMIEAEAEVSRLPGFGRD